MKRQHILSAAVMFFVWFSIHGVSFAQEAAISGRITDSTGAVVVGANITVHNEETGIKRMAASNDVGYYTVGLLQQGNYRILVEMQGFKPIERSGIKLDIHQIARMDFVLEVGEVTQKINVDANASPLNFENAELKQAITPETLRELPLIVGGAVRSAAAFTILMPGVTTGAGANPFDARVNGGLQLGDEAVIDGVTLQQGMKTVSGMVAGYADYPWSPEAISEVSLLTSNYEPQYGSTTSSVMTANTKSGTNEWHGTLYEFLRNTKLNALQYLKERNPNPTVDERPKDIENDFGGNIAGPIKVPWLFWSGRKKTFAFVNYEVFRIRGGVTAPIISIPSLQERQGDFSDWRDSEGNLIPIFDPATTRRDPNDPSRLIRDQFRGCDPVNNPQPNVICPDRIQNSLAHQWLQFLPSPTFAGPLNNYKVPIPIPETVFNDSSLLDVRVDHYVGDKDHFFVTVHYRGSTAPTATTLPLQLATEDAYGRNYFFNDRFSWDHTFGPNLLNHFAFGYGGGVAVIEPFTKAYADSLPKISGAGNHTYPPRLDFENFHSFGNNNSSPHDTRPAYVANNLLTWVRGKHTLKFGGEHRRLADNSTALTNGSGTFGFSGLETGVLGLNSGNSIASFLLEQVDHATVNFQSITSAYPRARSWNFHFGDTWKVAPKLSINYGIRWDYAGPSSEKYDNFSFLDLVGPNPGAGNRPGRLAFAGSKWGAASFGRSHPEVVWHKGFGPRLGIAYSFSPKSVVRAGYGIFYAPAFYPGWGGGIAQDGFNAEFAFSSTTGGLTPAFILSQGFPSIPTDQLPPFIDSSYRNGQSLLYRPFDANRLPYSQQWNLTVEHQFTTNFYISAGYVANKGTRLPSRTIPINALDPRYLSLGSQLYNEFRPGDTSVNGVSLPYPGWVEQMRGCASSVAQALLPFPQYCDPLFGLNENAGNSTYHSFQLKAEKRFSDGFWMLGSYTLSKLLTSSDNVQTIAYSWTAAHGVISPYERQRNKALALDDVPQVLSLALVYQVPFGQGKRFLNQGGAVNKVLGGWQISSIFRASSGVPFYFRSSNCNVPGQFRTACIPSILPGANPWAQDKGNFDPNKSLFNATAFENSGPSGFQFQLGQGPRVSNLRGFAYHNQDLSLIKNIRIKESVGIQFRAELFNLWNWHIFTGRGDQLEWGGQPFDTDPSSPNFGLWNGAVSAPRNIQFALKILF